MSKRRRPRTGHQRPILSDLRGTDSAAKRRQKTEIHFGSDTLALGIPQSTRRREYTAVGVLFYLDDFFFFLSHADEFETNYQNCPAG